MTKKPNYVFDDELYHHGILGQRWGHRRFQNEDGSWTPEGRERYGEGGAREKSDVQKYKAKVSYNTQKYKANLKSRAQQEKDIRSAKEERVRIKENAKTTRIARKEQGKFDRLNKKEEARLDNQGRQKSFSLRKTRNMSDDDLQKAIDRLKLQAEYNKQYALATSPNSALAKADRFFEGPTGKMVRDIAVATVPTLATTAASKILDSRLKYANKEDREAASALIDKTRAEAESFRTKSDFQRSQAEEKRASIINANRKAELDLEETMKESNRKNAESRSKIRDANLAREILRENAARDYKEKVEQYTKTKNMQNQAYNIIAQDLRAGRITSDEYLEKLKKYGLL